MKATNESAVRSIYPGARIMSAQIGGKAMYRVEDSLADTRKSRNLGSWQLSQEEAWESAAQQIGGEEV